MENNDKKIPTGESKEAVNLVWETPEIIDEPIRNTESGRYSFGRVESFSYRT